MNENFIITGFAGVMRVDDKKGKINIKNRYAASFIVTVRGKIIFTSRYGRLISDNAHCAFLPKGLDYINECVEAAESYVFNFYTTDDFNVPLQLSHPSEIFCKMCFENINHHLIYKRENLLVYSELYLLASKMISEEPKSETEEILEKVIEFMNANYHNPHIKAADAANAVSVSEVYLYKLFRKKYNISPMAMLRNIRMQKAYVLALEKRPVKEIAGRVGYSDIFVFSRAYKKHFGKCPSET